MRDLNVKPNSPVTRRLVSEESRRWYESTRVIVVALLVLGICASSATGAQDPELEFNLLTSEMHELYETVLHDTELNRLNHEIGKLDLQRVADRAEDFRMKVEWMERESYGLPDDQREVMLRKIEAIRLAISTFESWKSGAPATVSAALWIDDPDVAHSSPSETESENDSCDSAQPIAIEDVFVGDTSTASNDGQAGCGASFDSRDVWFRYTAETTGYVYVDTFGSDFDTVLSVHLSCPGTPVNQVTCNDDTHGVLAAVSFNAYVGNDYYIRLAGMNDASGEYQIRLSTGDRITGTVEVSGEGSAIESCSVNLWTMNGLFHRSDSTDAEGNFELTGLVPGTYVAFTDCGYHWNEVWDNLPCPEPDGDSCDPTSGTPIGVTAGVDTSGIDFELSAYGTIRGRVLDENGSTPVSGARVRFYDQETGSQKYTAYSGPDGTYEKRAVAPGTYYLTVSHSEFAAELYDDVPCAPYGYLSDCNEFLGTPIAVNLDETVGDIDFDLRRYAQIKGTVTDEITGEPIYRAQVLLWDSAGTRLRYAYTSSSGAFTLGGLDPGTFYATAVDSDYAGKAWDDIPCDIDCYPSSGSAIVITEADQQLDGIDFALTPRGRIAGVVTDESNGTGIRSAIIYFYSQTGVTVDYQYTDSDGGYESDALRKGEYFSRPNKFGYVPEVFDDIPCDGECDPTSGTPIEVFDGGAASVADFALTPFGKISGFVWVDGEDEPLPSIRVEFFDEEGARVGNATTDSLGRYLSPGLPSGTYFVATNDHSGTIIDELYDNLPCMDGPPGGCNPTNGAPVEVSTSSTTSDIDFRVKKLGTISGHITSASTGDPLSYIDVVVLNADGLQVASKRSNSSGLYTVGGITPGDHYVVAGRFIYPGHRSNHSFQAFDGVRCPGRSEDRCDLSKATPISIGTGSEVTGIDFSLDKWPSIAGSIRSAESGEGLRNVYMDLFNMDGHRLDTKRSDDNGNYTLPDVLPGDYYVKTRASGLANELFDNVHCPGDVLDCSALATPVTADFGLSPTGIDFILDPLGSIGGRVLCSITGEPLGSTRVELWDDNAIITSRNTDNSGFYTFTDIFPGTYFVATDNWSSTSSGYLDELYDDIPCFSGPPTGCDVSKGEPVNLGTSENLVLRDIEVTPMTGISGRITEAATSDPIRAFRVDLFRPSTGALLQSTLTSPDGFYFFTAQAGTYWVATHNDFGYVDEIWQDTLCPNGSAAQGQCDLAAGDAVVIEPMQIKSGIDLSLMRSNDLIHFAGFETGNTTEWSLPQP